MAQAAGYEKLSERFESSQANGKDSVLKTFLNTFLDHLLGRNKHSWSNLYRTYAESFLAFINSRFPYQVSLLHLSVLHNMSLKNCDSDDESSPKSFRELLEDSRRQDLPVEDTLDTLLRYHSSKQADVSSHMVQMARALKTQSLAANSIIKRDVQSLEKARGSAEKNASALKEASDKLATCSKDGMNWCLVVLVIVVLMIFVNLVILMKVMKKN